MGAWRTSALNENDIRSLLSPIVCHHHHCVCSFIHHLFHHYLPIYSSLSLSPTPLLLICSYCHTILRHHHTLSSQILFLSARHLYYLSRFPQSVCLSVFPPRPFSHSLSPSLQTPRGSSFTEITWPSALSVPRHPRCPHTVSLHFQRSLDQPSEHAQQCTTTHTTGRYTTLYRSYSTQV